MAALSKGRKNQLSGDLGLWQGISLACYGLHVALDCLADWLVISCRQIGYIYCQRLFDDRVALLRASQMLAAGTLAM